MMISTCTTFRIEVPHHLAYEIFTFTAHNQILTGPSQLTLPKRNVRYLEKGQARGIILASLFCILNNTMIGIGSMQKIVLKLYMSPNVNRTDHRPYAQGRGSNSTYAQSDQPPYNTRLELICYIFYLHSMRESVSRFVQDRTENPVNNRDSSGFINTPQLM